MAPRSRKRRAGATPTASPAPPTPATSSPPAAAGGRQRRGYARGRERDEALRAQLEPLAPGERPRAVTVAIVVAAALAVANVVLYLAGYEVRGENPQPSGVAVFALLMVAAAVGMFLRQYWAVLGFQALLGISMIFSALSLLVASNLRGALLSLAVLLGSGTLFWFLVKAMARIQMPDRPGRSNAS